MLSVLRPNPTVMNGVGANMADGSGTINPAALDSTGKTSVVVVVVFVVSGGGGFTRWPVPRLIFVARAIPLVLSNASNVLDSGASPRGVKRSRSPDPYSDLPLAAGGGSLDDHGLSSPPLWSLRSSKVVGATFAHVADVG